MTLWLDLCERLGLPAATVEPTRSKWDAETFRRITGWSGRTNEHGRDAARFVFRLSTEQALLMAGPEEAEGTAPDLDEGRELSLSIPTSQEAYAES